eukprot:symbB.v1.2.031444.t1/scaffold3650.1/size52688/8
MPHVQVGGILGGISCPPALLHGILPEYGQSLMLIHLTTDRLCQWHPYDETLSSLNCKYCIVDRSTQELRELFGACEHSYGHWIDLSLPHGRYPLYQLLRRYSDVAPPQARDIAPLRLVSWVSCEVPDHVQQVLNQLMALFGAVALVSSDEVLAIGVQQLGVTSSGEISWDMVRDALIREITFGGTTCPTEEVCRLMAEFLQRLPLPRLVHFLDMILPQMVPVQSPCQSRRGRFASSYRIAERTAWGEWDVEYYPQCDQALLVKAGPPYDKQRIQMGLRSGNTVLICFRSGVGHFQSVLIALAADLHTNKPWQGQHKFWKYVSPIRTYFAWLPERLARTYCSAALDKCPDIPYGEVHHLQGSEDDEKHSLVFQNIYHIGDTKTAQELEVFLRMSRERLRLCCGLQCTDRLHPNGPRQRQKLFHAALKLLWFAIGIKNVRCENAAQVALHAAIRPLLRLEDEHVLATLRAIVLALCEGRTGLAISGVFGAGKTRSAAVLLAGLLVFDPSLKLMVLTKENIAAHAFAEHLVSLQMPDYLQEKMGRLVGYYEQNRKGSYTPLDILPSNRNQDEGQQYGNMEEAATVARTPATCLEVWSGDHRQTPGGLKKSQEAKAFRKKLTKRPLALRCQTQYIQAHEFGKIVLRYLDCPKESFAWKLRHLLIDGSAAIDPAVGQFWHELIGDSPPCLSTEIQRAACAILWMGLRGEREGLPSLATSFAEAAGVSGRQKWGLVLSSSARVSQVTYQTVVGVRYPELVTFNGTQWQFGKYVQQERPLPGLMAQSRHFGAVDLHMDNALDGSECPSYLVWLERDGQSYTLLDTSTTDTLPLNHDFFRPLGMEHFYDSFALVSQISVRREALHLFGLREDELLPDLHITTNAVLRIGLGAHQEHRVNHVARATDRSKVSADVIQLAAHEEDPAPEQVMSEGDASDSDGSESASDSEQNDPPSSLVADAEQYELMQIAYAAVGKDFTGNEDLIGSEYRKLQKLEMVPERWPLARLSFSPRPGKEKENDPAVAWQGLQRIPTHPNSGSHRLLALASVTGLEVLVMLTPYRSGFRPTGMDQEVAPVDIRKQWQEARANRRMQFKVGNYRDGSWESNIRMLTGTIKVDWIQLPVEQGLWPTNCWPEVSMMGADNLRKVAGYDFHHLRKKYDVRTMWGDLDPQWWLLQSQLEARGPGWYSPADLKERLFTNKSKRPGDDTTDALRTDGNTIAWQAWDTARNIIWQSCQPGPPLVFPGEKEIFRAMYAQIGEEEQVISPPYTRTPLDAYEGTEEEKAGRGQCPGWVVNPGWWLGLDSTCVYIYEGALLPVELSQRHPQDGGLLCLSTSSLLKAGVSNYWKYGILRAAEEAVRAGVLSDAPGI